MKEKTGPRLFNSKQRTVLYLVQDGRCAICGVELTPGWHADHLHPWALGGETSIVNGQALCPTCNRKKGMIVQHMGSEVSKFFGKKPREWQLEAWDTYAALGKADFLLCVTPGGGKTTWALITARRLLDDGTIERVVIVAPTQTIRDQWANQTIVNVEIVKNRDGGIENPKDFEGCVLTYAQMAAGPDLQRRGCLRAKTLVIFDEVHHAGYPNRSWGDNARSAFEQSVRRIALTGTPWRRPGQGNIAFVIYNEEGKLIVDYPYEYGSAVRDGVCRSVEFRAYDGTVQYVTLDMCAPQTFTYSLEDEDDSTQVLRDLLKPTGEWMRTIIQKAHTELLNIRAGEDGEGAIPDAKGLIIADNQQDARELGKMLERLTLEKPEIIISDEPDAEQALERFKTGRGFWAVAVNKVSEGVDVPALYVGIYATRKKTPLIFRQIIGRFVRRRVDANGNPRPEEDRAAVVFMPAVETLKSLAEQMENELRHSFDEDIEEGEEELQRTRQNQDGDVAETTMLPTDTSPAELDTVIYSGETYSSVEYANAEATARKVGIPLAYVSKLAAAIRLQISNIPTTPPVPPATPQPEQAPRNKMKQALLQKIRRLANSRALERGIDFKEFNKELAKKFGGTRRGLSIEQLKKQLEFLESMSTE